jgi:hypothetical protein
MDASFSFTLHRYGFQLSVIWDEQDNRRELPISRFDRWRVGGTAIFCKMTMFPFWQSPKEQVWRAFLDSHLTQNPRPVIST